MSGHGHQQIDIFQRRLIFVLLNNMQRRNYVQRSHNLATAFANFAQALDDAYEFRTLHEFRGVRRRQRFVRAVVVRTRFAVFPVNRGALFGGAGEFKVTLNFFQQKLEIRAFRVLKEVRTGPADVGQTILHLQQHQLTRFEIKINYRTARADDGQQGKSETEFEGEGKAHVNSLARRRIFFRSANQRNSRVVHIAIVF